MKHCIINTSTYTIIGLIIIVVAWLHQYMGFVARVLMYSRGRTQERSLKASPITREYINTRATLSNAMP